MSRPRVFVIQPIPEVALDLMREVADVEVYPYSDRMITLGELRSAVKRADYLFVMHETMVPRSVIESNPSLKGIAVGGQDYGDMIDVEACEQYGVQILKHDAKGLIEARHGNAKATADLAIVLLLNLAYRVLEADAYTRAGRFRQEMTLEMMGQGCTGKVAGVIGVGFVGTEIIRKLKALDMDVLYTKRTRLSPEEEAELGATWVEDMNELIAASDYVVMMANYHDGALKLMGAEQFALMKPTAFFINVARGRLIDEPAMIKALQDGTLAGAGLDVYWDEPPVVHDPDVPIELRRLHNVVLAPHNGGATWDSRGRQTSYMATSIIDHINGTYTEPEEGAW